MLLHWLPRLALLPADEASRERVDLSMSLRELSIDETEASDQRGDVGCGRLHGAGVDRHRLLARDREDVGRIDAANPMAFEELRDGWLADPASLERCRGELPEVEQPVGSEVFVELEKGGKIAPKLLAHSARQPVALGDELVGDPQLDDRRVDGRQMPKALRIGAQCRRQSAGIAAIVLGAGHRKAIAEALELLRIDGVDVEAPLHQRFDHRSVRNLDRNMDLGRVGLTGRGQPAGHLGKASAAMGEDTLTDIVAVLVGQSNVVALASPVDAGEPSSLCVHAGFPIVTRATATLAGPCTGARSAVSSRGLCRGRFAGARVPPRCSKHSGRWVAPEPAPAVTTDSPAVDKVALFRKLFAGRTDVFPIRWENPKSSRTGYAPACANEWVRGVCGKPHVRCSECLNQSFIPVTDEVIEAHLRGEDRIRRNGGGDFVAGVYPLLFDDTCRFLAVDFDGESWSSDALAFMATCREIDVPAALERSRSGNGGHV